MFNKLNENLDNDDKIFLKLILSKVPNFSETMDFKSCKITLLKSA